MKETYPATTLLSPEEVSLAKKLNEFIEEQRIWKFCRGGGESLAVAARIGRSISKSHYILTCGYHGFHDWYLSSNLNKNSLDGTFIKGLNIVGIPEEYEGTTSSVVDFSAEALRSAIKKKNRE